MAGMSGRITIDKGRTNVVKVDLGVDVSGDTLTSEIRASQDRDSQLIATFTVAPETDYTDGKLRLSLDNTITAGITQTSGYMDIKRIIAGEPYSVFNQPLEVFFQGTVTA